MSELKWHPEMRYVGRYFGFDVERFQYWFLLAGNFGVLKHFSFISKKRSSPNLIDSKNGTRFLCKTQLKCDATYAYSFYPNI